MFVVVRTAWWRAVAARLAEWRRPQRDAEGRGGRPARAPKHMLNFSRKKLGWRVWAQRARLADAADERDLVRRLDTHQLRTLLCALETKDPDAECVPAPPDAPAPHVPACRGWRWPDLGSARELRPLPHCKRRLNCCNPYHWSRLSKPGTILLISKQRRATFAVLLTYTSATIIHYVIFRSGEAAFFIQSKV